MTLVTCINQSFTLCPPSQHDSHMKAFTLTRPTSAQTQPFSRAEMLDNFIIRFLLPFGLFIQLTGVTWLGKGAATSQTYVWLMLPALVSALLNIRQWRHLKFGVTEIAFLLFIGWAAVSWFWSDTDTAFNDLLKRCLYIILYVYSIARVAQDSRKFEQLMLVATAVIAVSALVALVNHYVLQGQPLGYRAYRISSMGIGKLGDIGYPINAGIYYGAFAAFLFSWLCIRPQSRLSIATGFGGLAILLVYVLMTWSRGPILAVLGAMFATCIFIRNQKTNTFLSMGIIVTLAVFVLFKDFLLSPNVADTDLNGRTQIWISALKVITESPIIGHGFDSHTQLNLHGNYYAPHAHNYALQAIIYYGLIGFSFLAAFVTGALWHIRKWWQSVRCKYAFFLLVYGGICMISDVYKIIIRPDEYWLLIWLPLALVLGVKHKSMVQKTN